MIISSVDNAEIEGPVKDFKSRLNDGTRLSNRIISVRFSYSPPDVIPEFFSITNFGPFVVPDDIGRLIARLHKLNIRNDQVECPADLNALNMSVRQFEDFASRNKDWIQRRFPQEAEDDKNIEGFTMIDQLRFISNRILPNLSEQSELVERFGLLDPESNGEVVVILVIGITKYLHE